jgi:hypothetical protein
MMNPASCRTARHLVLEKVGGGESGSPDELFGHLEARLTQACAEVARREDRVVGQHEVGLALVAPLLQQLGGAGQRTVLMDENAVHVGQPAFDVFATSVHCDLFLSVASLEVRGDKARGCLCSHDPRRKRSCRSEAARRGR